MKLWVFLFLILHHIFSLFVHITILVLIQQPIIRVYYCMYLWFFIFLHRHIIQYNISIIMHIYELNFTPMLTILKKYLEFLKNNILK